jgi:hypothetical protein
MQQKGKLIALLLCAVGTAHRSSISDLIRDTNNVASVAQNSLDSLVERGRFDQMRWKSPRLTKSSTGPEYLCGVSLEL